MRMSDREFDAALDAYQEREYELSLERAVRANKEAQRSSAAHIEITFSGLVVGDYMTAEPEAGPNARFVEVKEIRPGENDVEVMFETPQPLGVSYTSRWWITRPKNAPVVIDGAAREALRHAG